MGRIDITENYVRVRMFNPRLCQQGTYVTLDVGRPGKTKAVRCMHRKKNSMETQAWLLPRDEVRVVSRFGRKQLEALTPQMEVMLEEIRKAGVRV